MKFTRELKNEVKVGSRFVFGNTILKVLSIRKTGKFNNGFSLCLQYESSDTEYLVNRVIYGYPMSKMYGWTLIKGSEV